MDNFLDVMVSTTLSTLRDVTPIVIILVFFQVAVLRRRLPNLRAILAGSVMVLFGLALFLIGLEEALFPIGETMARQLTSAETIGANALAGVVRWEDYWLIYIFAAAIGFAMTVAEPALIAVALKAQEVSGGSVNALGLRIAVAIGVAAGVSLGCFRIVTGTPLPWYIVVAYVIVIVIVQTYASNRTIVPLAYDSGGVTTSTVTVPVVTALGLGLASSVPGRSPLIDGFGLIAFASVFPIMSVLGYAIIAGWVDRWRRRKDFREVES